jgi:hypothetical protein
MVSVSGCCSAEIVWMRCGGCSFSDGMDEPHDFAYCIECGEGWG